ncbi:hypothetical protein ACB098_03G163200 [Castanea mollissima]
MDGFTFIVSWQRNEFKTLLLGIKSHYISFRIVIKIANRLRTLSVKQTDIPMHCAINRNTSYITTVSMEIKESKCIRMIITWYLRLYRSPIIIDIIAIAIAITERVNATRHPFPLLQSPFAEV